MTLPPDLATNAAETFDVVVTSPEPASCQSSEAIKVVVVPPPLVTNIIPPGICVDQGDQVVTVQGGFFARINGTDVPTVGIKAADGTAETFAVTALANCVAPDSGVSGVELCDTLTFTVTRNALPPGNYTLTVTNPEPVGCTSTDEIDLASIRLLGSTRSPLRRSVPGEASSSHPAPDSSRVPRRNCTARAGQPRRHRRR